MHFMRLVWTSLTDQLILFIFVQQGPQKKLFTQIVVLLDKHDLYVIYLQS